MENIEEFSKKYTKVNFIKIMMYKGFCSDRFGLKTWFNCDDTTNKDCKKCWEESVKDIKFKGEEVVEGEKVEEVIKVRCKRNVFDFEKDKTYKAERTITGAYKLMNDKGVYHIFFGTDFSNYFEKVADDDVMVKCIDNQQGLIGLIIGRIYKVIREDDRQYKVLNECDQEVWCNKSRFKPVEPLKEEKKEYTVIELLEFPVGTKFKDNEGCEVEVARVEETTNEKKIILSYVDDGEDNTLEITSIWARMKFTKVELKQVNTPEAFKALEEGKTIESTYTGDKYKKENGLLVIQGKGFNNYCKCGSVAASELTNSWIILE